MFFQDPYVMLSCKMTSLKYEKRMVHVSRLCFQQIRNDLNESYIRYHRITLNCSWGYKLV
jgi:hypothetical protein